MEGDSTTHSRAEIKIVKCVSNSSTFLYIIDIFSVILLIVQQNHKLYTSILNIHSCSPSYVFLTSRKYNLSCLSEHLIYVSMKILILD